MQPQKNICWIFCNVIDNYGDAGVSWRLAQGISNELGYQVHFWIDSISTLQMLCPNLSSPPSVYQNIHIHFWQKHNAQDIQLLENPHLVIETFACELPDNVLTRIQKCKPLWLNWEYLSAEENHEKLHGLPSLHISGVPKYFWFMGFSEHAGGLLRESNYQQTIQKSHQQSIRTQIGLTNKISPEWLLFGYHSPIWAKWLNTWQQLNQPMTLLLAGNQIIDSLKSDSVIPKNVLLKDGDIFQTASITLIKLPFVKQQNFDALLSSLDGLIVRGEDSFVRAQLSGKPFFWHIYPQDNNVHIEKLHAFWEKAHLNYPTNLFTMHQLLSDELNGIIKLNNSQRLEIWKNLWVQYKDWQQSTQNWQTTLFKQDSALEKLAKFITNKLK